tara:strand:+ start:2256 stop:2786 length:531 start_codon:yes stop_codon:yes gene_type:complete
MARYKKYKYGGKRIPGMFKKQEGGEEMDGFTRNKQNMEQLDSLANKAESRYRRGMGIVQNLAMSNAIKNNQAKQDAMINQNMQETVMQIKLNNQALEQQNNLLKTQIQKMDLINSARTTKQSPGMKNTPKRKGGSIKGKKGKEKIMFFAQSSGGTMKHGGSCGGPLMSMMKRNKRK